MKNWLRISNPWSVMLAAQRDSRACDAAVSRLIDTMLDLQLDHRHLGTGYPPISPTALAGEAPGGGGHGDAMLSAYLKRKAPSSQWHLYAQYLLRQIPQRQAAAMLMQAARVRPGHGKEGCAWCLTTAQMIERQQTLLRMLGMPGAGEYADATALQRAGREARAKLREQVLAYGESRQLSA